MPYVRVNKNPRIKILIGTVLVLILVAFLLFKSNLDPKQILMVLSALDPKYLGVAFAINASQVLFWVLRAWPLLPKESKLPFSILARAIALGQFLNSFAPARAGDVTKVMLLSSNKLKDPLRPTTAVGLLATDKLIDIVSIFLLAFVSGATGIGGKERDGGNGSYFYLLLIPAAVIALFLIIPQKWKVNVKLWFSEFLQGVKPLLSPKASLLSLAAGLCVWISEALTVLLVLKAAGIVVNFSDAVYIVCIVNLGILIPVSVANVGAYEAAFVYAVSKFNVETESAVAIAIALHFLSAAAMSLWALAMLRVGKKSTIAVTV